jgi:hypothetical protein
MTTSFAPSIVRGALPLALFFGFTSSLSDPSAPAGFITGLPLAQ